MRASACACVCVLLIDVLMLIISPLKRQRKEREKVIMWCQDVQRSPSNNMPCFFLLCVGDFHYLEIINLFLLRVFQFLH